MFKGNQGLWEGNGRQLLNWQKLLIMKIYYGNKFQTQTNQLMFKKKRGLELNQRNDLSSLINELIGLKLLIKIVYLNSLVLNLNKSPKALIMILFQLVVCFLSIN